MGNKIKHLLFLIIIVMTQLNPNVSLYAEEKDKELPETYIIKKGDTLWGVSEKFFKNPFSWPDVWQKNDYINNPDLIYPGNKLLLRKIMPPALPEQKEKEPVEAKVTKPRKKRIAKSVTPPKPKKIPITDASTFRSAGFIVKEDFRIGNIIGSQEKHTILGYGDLIYTDIGLDKSAIVGKKFTIYRVIKEVIHPVNKEEMGYLIRVLGVLKIKQLYKTNSLAFIVESYEDITDKDFITDYVELEIPMIDPSIKPPEKRIQGYIIETKNTTTIVGFGDIVYLDIGGNKGAALGDTFVAYNVKEDKPNFLSKMGFPAYKKKSIQYPKNIIGELKIISMKDETSTALITKTYLELGIGEKVEYKLVEKTK